MAKPSSGQILSLHTLLLKGRPLSIGTLHEGSAIRNLKKVASLPLSRRPDLLEARLDSLLAAGVNLPSAWPLPVVATARHPQEGGEGNLDVASRRRLLEGAIPWASAIDVELRSVRFMAPLIAMAHQHGRTVILSHHDFKATPSLSTLKKLASAASVAGADLFKVATFLRDRNDLRRLVELQTESLSVQVTAMGMGDAGRFSRLVLAGFGAPLCYGWLGCPQVPGQWPALELPAMLSRILPG